MNQHELENLKLVSSALATPCIAIFAAWIAYHQYRIQEYRLIIDLRDKILPVFYAVRQLVRDSCSDARTTNDSLNNYRISAAELPFFLEPRTISYSKELEARFERMLQLKELIDDNADGDSEILEQAKRELREKRQTMRQEHIRLQDEFRPYLKLPAKYLTMPSTRAAIK
jgi:uncharacterized protein YdcH (DUF465 family)